MDALPTDVRSLLKAPNLAHVATVMPDGSPHSVPTWVAVRDDQVVFLTGPRSQKARNIEREPRISLSITDSANPALMAHVRGHVVERIAGDDAWRIIDEMAQQYVGADYPRGEERVVFVVAADHAVAHDFS